MKEKLFVIGKVTAVRSYKGQIKVWILAEYLEYLRAGSRIFINDQPYTVNQFLPHRDDCCYLKLQSVDDEETARALVGCSVQLPENLHIALTENEYLLRDLMGMTVRTQDGLWEGKLINVLQYPANDVYILQKDGKESLIPAVKDIVKSVDVEKKLMIIDPAIGMLS